MGSSAGGSSSSPPLGLVAPLGLPVSENLSKKNLQLWKMQVLPTNRGAQLDGFLDGSVLAPPKEISTKTRDVVAQEANPEWQVACSRSVDSQLFVDYHDA
jgi:hypothetical protein